MKTVKRTDKVIFKAENDIERGRLKRHGQSAVERVIPDPIVHLKENGAELTVLFRGPWHHQKVEEFVTRFLDELSRL